MQAVIACAPFIPSGWLWDTEALIFASSNVSSNESTYNPTGLTRMADPFQSYCMVEDCPLQAIF